MKILVDKVELQKLLDEITFNQSDGIRKTREGLTRILDQSYIEEWVVIEPRPVVKLDNTKTGFDKYSVEGNFNIINFFANKEDALREVEKNKNYAHCMVVKAMDFHKLVRRDKLAKLRDIIAKLELSYFPSEEYRTQLCYAHQLIYEMQNEEL